MSFNLGKVKNALNSYTQECPECLNLKDYSDKEMFVDYQLILGQIAKLLTERKLSKNTIQNISDNIDNIILAMLDLNASQTCLLLDVLGEVIQELEELLVENEEYESAQNLKNLNDFKNKVFPITKNKN
jgi:hypothetical protein